MNNLNEEEAKKLKEKMLRAGTRVALTSNEKQFILEAAEEVVAAKEGKQPWQH
jgi:hypothetical protein